MAIGRVFSCDRGYPIPSRVVWSGTLYVPSWPDCPNDTDQRHDNGEGIDPAELPHIWDRFYRAEKPRHPGTSEGDGSGLGLAIVRGIVEAAWWERCSPILLGPWVRVYAARSRRVTIVYRSA